MTKTVHKTLPGGGGGQGVVGSGRVGVGVRGWGVRGGGVRGWWGPGGGGQGVVGSGGGGVSSFHSIDRLPKLWLLHLLKFKYL